jgi:predicted membrane-bound spermidine synthase
MSLYREKDGDLFRDYVLNRNVETYSTEKATLEVVPSKEFGEMLFLDGELELAQKDEYIYHEMLVHPAMSTQVNPQEICVLGGGDGCCVREILKWRNVQRIDIYDWDKDLVNLFSTKFSSWNSKSLQHPSVHMHIQNVLDISWNKQYDVVFVDLVDPNYDDAVSRNLWQNLIAKLPSLLKSSSTLVINSGGIRPWNTRNVEWILMMLAGAFQSNTSHTIEVYKTFVPSFAYEWCFFLIKPTLTEVKPYLSDRLPVQHIGPAAWFMATSWSKDYEGRLPIEPVKLNRYLPPL